MGPHHTENIDSIYVRGRNDAMIPLPSLVNVRASVSPRELNHFGQRRSATITANLTSDYSLGQAITFMNDTATKVHKPGYTTDLNDTSHEFKNSQGALGAVFVLALMFIFLVLAAQFESFIDPLVIMVSMPLSMIGALLALKWSGGSLNVYSQIGLITLVGLMEVLVEQVAARVAQASTACTASCNSWPPCGRTRRATSLPSFRKTSVGHSFTPNVRPRRWPGPSSTLMWAMSARSFRAASISGWARWQWPHHGVPNSTTVAPARRSTSSRDGGWARCCAA